jgi:tryptophan-rich sensory protein
MTLTHNIDLKKLAISLGLSLGVGGLSAIVSMGSQESFEAAVKPPLTPPAFLFPIVWTILFLLMGVSAYLIYNSNTEEKEVRSAALYVYIAQLLVNFFWPVIFFNLAAYFSASVWIILLLILIIVMIALFSRISKPAAYLQIPYLLWVSFATYLTIAVAVLN